MQLFCFASRNAENIQRGIRAKMWAVSTVGDSVMRSRRTKAERYFGPHAKGVLYCNPTHSFTMPFIATSKADPDQVVADVWPEPWVLPFSIQPLGDLRRQLHKDEAAKRWPILFHRMAHMASVSAALNITGTTVFVPTEITEEDWGAILRDLAIETDYA